MSIIFTTYVRKELTESSNSNQNI